MRKWLVMIGLWLAWLRYRARKMNPAETQVSKAVNDSFFMLYMNAVTRNMCCHARRSALTQIETGTDVFKAAAD